MDITRRMTRAGVVQNHYRGRFPVFLRDYFAWLGFELTPMQADIGNYMSDNTLKNKCVMAQRGEAKSTIAIARALYELVDHPNGTVLFVSGSDDYAGTLSHAVVTAIMQWDRLDWLRPEAKAGARTSYTDGFDVHHAFRIPDKQPTIKAVGIFGQLQGNHVSLLIADDVETTSNGMSPANRARINTLTKEFAAIANDGAEILYLGTPQTQDSMYNSLPQRGFDVRIWPGRFPTIEEEEKYGGCLAPWIIQQMAEHPEYRTGYGILGTRGRQTDPARYSEDKQLQNERDYQQAGFQLQFMLDTSMADALRQRLAMRDLIVFDGSVISAPEILHWSNNPRHIFEVPPDFPLAKPNLFLAADFSDKYVEFTNVMGFLDPGGGGKDESVIILTASIGPFIHALDMLVYHGGQTLENIADAVTWCAERGCKSLTIEDNMGHGIVTNVYRGEVIKQGTGMDCVGIYSTTQKETRIISQLSTVMQRHRLVLHKAIVDADLRYCRAMSDGGREYSLFYQMQNLTPDRGSLSHDDRIEVLAAAVHLHKEVLQLDEDKASQERSAAAGREFINNPMGYDDSRRPNKPTNARGTRRRVR